MTRLRIALVGAAGRMGQAVLGVAESEGVEVVAGLISVIKSRWLMRTC